MCNNFSVAHKLLFLVEISCGIPPGGVNTKVVPQTALYFDEVYTYTCLSRYATDDETITECLATGQLSQDPPTCTGM